MAMKVYFASDHAGFDAKNRLVEYVRDELKCEVEDCGALVNDPQDDYPEIIAVPPKTSGRLPRKDNPPLPGLPTSEAPPKVGPPSLTPGNEQSTLRKAGTPPEHNINPLSLALRFPPPPAPDPPLPLPPPPPRPPPTYPLL